MGSNFYITVFLLNAWLLTACASDNSAEVEVTSVLGLPFGTICLVSGEFRKRPNVKEAYTEPFYFQIHKINEGELKNPIEVRYELVGDVEPVEGKEYDFWAFESFLPVGDPPEWPFSDDGNFYTNHLINLLKSDKNLARAESGLAKTIRPTLAAAFGTIIRVDMAVRRGLDTEGIDYVATVTSIDDRTLEKPVNIEGSFFGSDPFETFNFNGKTLAYECIYSTGYPIGWPGSEKKPFAIHHAIEMLPLSKKSGTEHRSGK